MFEGEASVQSFEQKLDEEVAKGASVKKVVPRPAEGNMELRLLTVASDESLCSAAEMCTLDLLINSSTSK